MKLLHCADLHLDSKMNANLDKDKAKERRDELLRAFVRMVDYAQENGISAILIAGDLFDTRNVLVTTKRLLETTIREHPDICFYYLRGNHDNDNSLSNLEELPDNLKMFGDEWTSYSLDVEGQITLTGMELGRDSGQGIYHSLLLDADKINIVTLHGQESQAEQKDKAEVINISALKNKCIDYLALGHIHAYKLEKLDARGSYCYSGCLEGRGFDECGEHGFVVLDIDPQNHTVVPEFVPFAKRKLYTLPVDISGCGDHVEALKLLETALNQANISEENMLKVVLCGNVDVEVDLNVDYMVKSFEDRYYFLKIYDETGAEVDEKDYALEASLKGEFVRKVMADESLEEEDRMEIIRIGLKALRGEELDA